MQHVLDILVTAHDGSQVGKMFMPNSGAQELEMLDYVISLLQHWKITYTADATLPDGKVPLEPLMASLQEASFLFVKGI